MAALDPQAIERLRKLGGHRLLDRMIELFLTHAPERVRTAREAILVGDTEGIGRAMHSLKSSAGNVGALRLMELAANVERSAFEGQMATLAKTLPALESELAEVIKILESLRGEPNA